MGNNPFEDNNPDEDYNPFEVYEYEDEEDDWGGTIPCIGHSQNWIPLEGSRWSACALYLTQPSQFDI